MFYQLRNYMEVDYRISCTFRPLYSYLRQYDPRHRQQGDYRVLHRPIWIWRCREIFEIICLDLSHVRESHTARYEQCDILTHIYEQHLVSSNLRCRSRTEFTKSCYLRSVCHFSCTCLFTVHHRSRKKVNEITHAA
jgi:hypothetical protein